MTDVSPLELNGLGTTIDTDVDITFDTRSRKFLTIHLENTGANGLTYHVDSYAIKAGALPFEEVAAANVAAAGVVQIVVTKKTASVVVHIKSQGAGNPTTYAYEAIQAVF
jgi:hypothetical protein